MDSSSAFRRTHDLQRPAAGFTVQDNESVIPRSRMLDQHRTCSLICQSISSNGNAASSHNSSISNVDRACLEFCIALLDHSLKGNIYDSVFVGYLAVLGLKVRDRNFHDLSNYTSHLSALIDGY